MYSFSNFQLQPSDFCPQLVTERDCIYKLKVSCVWPRKYLCKSPRPEFHNIVSQFYSGVSLVKGGGSYKFHGQDTKMNVENEEWNKNVMSCSPLPGLWFESLQYIRYLVLHFTTSTGQRNTSHSLVDDTHWHWMILSNWHSTYHQHYNLVKLTIAKWQVSVQCGGHPETGAAAGV